MKKFALAAAAFATLFSGAAMASPYNGQQNDRSSSHQVEQRQDAKQQDNRRNGGHTLSRSWKKGDRFDSRQARNYRQIDARSHGLKSAPHGYRWVQSGHDAILIGTTSGVIASIVVNALR